jgi:hypothetical protein
MKTVKFFLIGFGAILFAFQIQSCENGPLSGVVYPPTPTEWEDLRASALDKFIQRETIDIISNTATFVSDTGVTLSIYTYCLVLEDGTPIDQTGQLDLEYIEVFDKSSMVLTNKPTMGHSGDGNKRLLETGGEFYVNITQGGKKIVATCSSFMSLMVPKALTTDESDMSLWNGVIDENGNLTWVEEDINQEQGGVFKEGANYYVSFGKFGWTNIDRFVSFLGEKAAILVAPPIGFDHKNCAVYVSVDGEGSNSLAQLDVVTPKGYFSEHYGYLPIGIDIHLIFVSVQNGKWLYAIKGVKTEKDKVFNITEEELKTGVEADLVADVNALQ